MTLKFRDRAADEWGPDKIRALLKVPLRLDREGQHLDVPDAEVVSTNESASDDAHGLKCGAANTHLF